MCGRKLAQSMVPAAMGCLFLLQATASPAHASAATDARACLRQAQSLNVVCLLGLRRAGLRGSTWTTGGRLCWQAARMRAQTCRAQFLAASGSHPVGADLWGSGPQYDVPTLSTDKADYHRGDVITISGGGWQSWERVSIVVSVNPSTHADVHLMALADEDGNFTNTDYVVQSSDSGAILTVTATGSSGLTAQTAAFGD